VSVAERETNSHLVTKVEEPADATTPRKENEVCSEGCCEEPAAPKKKGSKA